MAGRRTRKSGEHHGFDRAEPNVQLAGIGIKDARGVFAQAGEERRVTGFPGVLGDGEALWRSRDSGDHATNTRPADAKDQSPLADHGQMAFVRRILVKKRQGPPHNQY
jgi:hypothetical protein